MTQRVFFRDIKPYDAPDSLDELRGPASGTVTLSKGSFWAPNASPITIDTFDGLHLAYRNVIVNGTKSEQVRILNRDRLISAWPRLNLPDRARRTWETQFPELRTHS